MVGETVAVGLGEVDLEVEVGLVAAARVAAVGSEEVEDSEVVVGTCRPLCTV